MSDRYKRITLIDNRFWNDKCPITILKGALLFDAIKEKHLLQFKFCSKSSSKIVAFTLHVDCYAVGVKEICESLDYQFLDLDIKTQDSFGEDRAVYIESINSRSFSFVIKNIVYFDNSVDASIYEMNSIPNSQPIQKMGKNEEAFKALIPNAKFIPIFAESYWICKCGEINGPDNAICDFCKMDKSILLSSIRKDVLDNKLAFLQAEKEKKLAEENKRKEEDKQKKQRRNRILAFAFAIICSFGVMIWLMMPYIKKRIEQKSIIDQATKAISEGDLITAIELYDSIGLVNDDYNETCYSLAESFYNVEDYSKAIEYLNRIPDYGDARSLIEKCNDEIIEAQNSKVFAEAISAFNRGDYVTASRLFDELPRNYKTAWKLKWFSLVAENYIGTWVYEDSLFFDPDEDYSYWCNVSLSLLDDGSIYATFTFDHSTFSSNSYNIAFDFPMTESVGKPEITAGWKDDKYIYSFKTNTEGYKAELWMTDLETMELDWCWFER